MTIMENKELKMEDHQEEADSEDYLTYFQVEEKNLVAQEKEKPNLLNSRSL